MRSEKKRSKWEWEARHQCREGAGSMLGSLWQFRHLQEPSTGLGTTHTFPYLTSSMVLPGQHFHPQPCRHRNSGSENTILAHGLIEIGGRGGAGSSIEK